MRKEDASDCQPRPTEKQQHEGKETIQKCRNFDHITILLEAVRNTARLLFLNDSSTVAPRVQ
jgi:hypothetical protein